MLDGAGSNPSIRSVTASLILALAALSFTHTCAIAATGKLKLSRTHRHPEMLVMTWRGIVRPGMAKVIRAAFEKHKDSYRVIEFIINSPGGSVREGERVIEVLQDIEKTHRLYTTVLPGKTCGSMCVFIYVQGQKRFAAPASIWLFHEVSRSDKRTHKIYELDRPQWEQLIEKYWLPAGVNPVWIAEMKEHTFQTDYYQTGQSLLEHDSVSCTKPCPMSTGARLCLAKGRLNSDCSDLVFRQSFDALRIDRVGPGQRRDASVRAGEHEHEGSDRVSVAAALRADKRSDAVLERVIGRLSLE